MDRISDLPDSILSHILSLLPIKSAVGTNILSKRWKDIFPFGHSTIYLDLDDSLLLNPVQNETNSDTASFKDFVDKLLFTTLHDVCCVEHMNLECKKNYAESDVISWVSAALRLNVRHLMLSVSLYDTEVLSETLDGCASLVSLKLAMKCYLVIPYDFSLPSIKSLYLYDLEFDDCDAGSINELIEGCPLLEDLHLVGCDVSSLTELIIECPLLKNLVLEKNWLKSGKNITILKLHAPNLEHLKFSDHVACGYSISTFKSLISAHIDVGPTAEHFEEGYYDDYYEYYYDEVDDDAWKYYTDASKIIIACSSTKHLYLTPCSVTALYKTSLQLPQFQNMIRFILGIVKSTTWIVLACVLESAPNLEHIEFQQEFIKSEIGFADFEQLLPSPPVCLEQHLKRIEFWEFDKKGDEYKLLNYFLQNGKVLEQLELDEVEIPIKKQNYGVDAVDSSYASTCCDIAPPGSSSSSYDPRLAEIIMQMKAGRAELDRAERAKEQMDQFRHQSARHRMQSTSMILMLREILDSNAPLATVKVKLTMSELLESKEQLAMMKLSDLSESESDLLESMINNNQSMIESMTTLIQRGFVPAQPPSQPLPAKD